MGGLLLGPRVGGLAVAWTLFLFGCWPALGAEPKLVFWGVAGGERVRVFSIDKGADPSVVRKTEARSEAIVLVYEDLDTVSSVEPVAVFRGTAVASFNESPARDEGSPTVADRKMEADIAGPQKLRVVCRDGTHISPSGRQRVNQVISAWRSCSRRRGVQRWYYTSTRDLNAVIATICSDYRLLAGKRRDCGEARRLLEIRNKSY